MREAREGGEVIRRRLASRLALSLLVSSTARKRSVSLGTGSMSMQSVARSTWEAVLSVCERKVVLHSLVSGHPASATCNRRMQDMMLHHSEITWFLEFVQYKLVRLTTDRSFQPLLATCNFNIQLLPHPITHSPNPPPTHTHTHSHSHR